VSPIPKLAPLLLRLLLAILAVGCATPPPPDYSPAQRRIDRLLAEIHLPEYAGALQRAALRVAGHPPDSQLAEDQRLRHRLESELDPDAVVSDVVRSVSQSYDEPAVTQLERFWTSAVGRRVHRESDAPYSLFARLGYRIFGGPDYVPPEREALARKLEDLTGSTQTTADLYLRIYQSMLRWYQARNLVDPKETEAAGGIDALIARERDRVDAIGAQHAIPFTLYAFSGLPTAALAEYVAQIESPAGQWFTRAVREALIETIDRRSQAIQR